MYEAFFELVARPFPSTPDPASYFPAASHEESLALLKCAMNDGEAIGVLLGEPGTGKTLLCHHLIDSVAPAHSLVFLNHINNASVEAFLQAVLHDLSLPYTEQREQQLRLSLVDYLSERFSHGGKTVLFIDEAQNLSTAQLEEIRLLTNLEGRTDKYVRAQITRVGGSPDSIFTASAMSEICEYAAGVPRRINQICHRALTLAFAHECGTLDGEYVHLAANQLFLTKPELRHEVHHPPTGLNPQRVFTDLGFDPPIPRSEETPLAPASVVEVGSRPNPWSETVAPALSAPAVEIGPGVRSGLTTEVSERSSYWQGRFSGPSPQI